METDRSCKILWGERLIKKFICHQIHSIVQEEQEFIEERELTNNLESEREREKGAQKE